jgi:hypothetical protein
MAPVVANRASKSARGPEIEATFYTLLESAKLVGAQLGDRVRCGRGGAYRQCSASTDASDALRRASSLATQLRHSVCESNF